MTKSKTHSKAKLKNLYTIVYHSNDDQVYGDEKIGKDIFDLYYWMKHMLGQKRHVSKPFSSLIEMFHRKFIAQFVHKVTLPNGNYLLTTEIDNKECPSNFKCVGIIYTTKEKIREKFNVQKITQGKIKEIKSILKDEIDKLNYSVR